MNSSPELHGELHGSEQHSECVTISDALQYLASHTGYDFERRTFQRWVDSGIITIDDETLILATQKVGGLWYLRRTSLERIVHFLAPAASAE